MASTPVSDAPAICRDERRRSHIVQHAFLNGIDSVEYERRTGPARRVLVVRFLRPAPAGAYGLPGHAELVHLYGGVRVLGIRVLAVTQVGDRLEIDVDREGDFSDYTLAVGWRRDAGGAWTQLVPEIDRVFATAAVNFKASCPVDFDCRAGDTCEPQRQIAPLIDYLAKDYASFRQLLLDTIPQLNPGWLERSPADVGMALVELLAYVGDHLSYFQDAVGTEAYLDTARHRVSARRHALLVDYRMHDGRNAWAYLHLATRSAGTVPAGTRVLTRLTSALRRETAPVLQGTIVPDAVIPAPSFVAERLDTDPALAGARVFETPAPIAVHPLNNEMAIHAWGHRECCLPRGARDAYVYVAAPNGSAIARRPVLSAGDYLLFEEVKGPVTGALADADPLHRHIVRLTTVEDTEDAAYGNEIVDGHLQPWTSGARLPLVRVAWSPEDALPFPLCLSAVANGVGIDRASVARGNIGLADHGCTVTETIAAPADPDSGQPSPVPPGAVFTLPIPHGPVTQQCPRREPRPRGGLACALRDAEPAVALRVEFDGAEQSQWTAVPTLLDSSPFERHFVVEIDDDEHAWLRFGDGEYGRHIAGAVRFGLTWRVGNGRSGNVGAEALALLAHPQLVLPDIALVRNPLAALDGTDPEPLEAVRRRAPAAFRAEQFRAVTADDYVRAALKIPGVSGAAAAFRWTGSWHTVCVAIDPADQANLIVEASGRRRLTPAFEHAVRTFLTRYRLAGYDLDIRAGEYVPLETHVDVCVDRAYFRGDVTQAVRLALGNRVNRDRSIGFFHPDRFTFATPVYLSALYAAIESVPGVEAATITRLRRFGKADTGALESGVLPMGPWEIALLDNDPSAMENGVLRVTGRGGK